MPDPMRARRAGFYARVDLTPSAQAAHAPLFRNGIHKFSDDGQTAGISDGRLPKAAGGKAIAILRIRKKLGSSRILANPHALHEMPPGFIAVP